MSSSVNQSASIYLKNDVAQSIDDARFRTHMFKALPPDSSFRVNAFRRSHITDSPESFKYVYPREFNDEQEVVYSTTCCNSATNSVVSGPKMEAKATETATLFAKSVTQPRQGRRAFTTRVIGLDTTEN